MSLNNVIAKINKLLSLANNNPNINEAKAATQAADKLMQEYRISTFQLEEEAGNKSDITESVICSSGKRTAWREVILLSICKTYGCFVYTYNTSANIRDKNVRILAYRAVGKENDIEICKYMFSWITDLLETMGKQESKGKGTGYGKSWLQGAAEGIQATFKELQKVNAENPAMMVLANREKEARIYITNKSNIKLGKSAPLYGSTSHSGALEKGFAFGKSVQIVNGMGGEKEEWSIAIGEYTMMHKVVGVNDKQVYGFMETRAEAEKIVAMRKSGRNGRAITNANNDTGAARMNYVIESCDDREHPGFKK